LTYEINTRVWLAELSRREGRPLTLAQVPEEELERIAGFGMDLVWLMGVWRTGPRAVEKARSLPELEREYRKTLPDFVPGDVIGSPYAVAEYSVDPGLGGPAALAGLRERLAGKGLGLILDFVSNHTALDHPWVEERPDLYVQGDQEALKREPGNFYQARTAAGPRVIAHGRDPYFPGWSDTAQINFLSRPARAACLEVLQTIAGQCDGVRCDMAILLLEEVFAKSWGERALRTAGAPPAEGEFWPQAIAAVRERHPRFLFVAEAYWGLEGKLQSLGFDFTYDKTLYDRLVGGDGPSVRAHLEAPLDYQSRSVRFLENHDEPRAAAALPWPRHRAAALLSSTLPGMTLYHQGQLEGSRVKLPVQLGRRPQEPVDEAVQSFYRRLLARLREPAFRQGSFRLLGVRPAWEGNPSFRDFLAHLWEHGPAVRVAAVNFGPSRGQCFVDLSLACGGRTVELVDLLSEAVYIRQGDDLVRRGLYLDLPPFGLHLFQVNLRPR
jgi:hypothetical protein